MQQTEMSRTTIEDRRELERNIKEIERKIVEFNKTSPGANMPEIRKYRKLRRMRNHV